MPIQLSVDLSDATFEDLRALVDAARTAGIDAGARLELEDSTLIITVEKTTHRDTDSTATDRGTSPLDWFTGHSGQSGPGRPAWDPSLGRPIGDAAIRSVIDILTGRQEPPRGGN